MMINLYDEAKLQELDGINQKLHIQRVETERWRLSESPYVNIYFDMDLVLGFFEEIEGDTLTIVKKLHAIREDRYESTCTETGEQSSTSISYRGHKERSIDLSDTRDAFFRCYCGGKRLVVDGSARL
ncbi:hypothetical protein Gorai_019227, partial [Gossypium raimondii]|nr:hypothetical protein [Gossypium raimondii]